MTNQISTAPATHFGPLAHYGLIRASGAEARSFLQAQLGNDLNLIDANHHQLNCYSNPKGRLLAIFRLFIHNGDYYLRMPHEILTATLDRLTIFVLRAQVRLEDVSGQYACLGISCTGDDTEATEVLRQITGTVPQQVGEMSHRDGVSILRVPGGETRYEVYAERPRIEAIQHSLGQHGEPLAAEQWACMDILAGIPNIYPNTREEFVAQMVNLQLIDGLSFKKGCYPGQEIVARMHYLGKLKRRMYLLHLNAPPPAPGTDIVGASGTAAVGKIVDARAVGTQITHALAVLNIASAATGDLHLESAQGPLLNIVPLPYPFEPVGRT